jgi:molybdopterin adenylyltransferase
MKVTVITISDRAYNNIYDDLSGKEIISILKDFNANIEINYTLVPDEKDMIYNAFKDNSDSNYILTTGGTGLSERDVTPEVTKDFCEKELPGIAETLRFESLKETKNAMLSRGYAGIKNKTIIVNFPGSVKAVRLCTKVLLPILEHGIMMINGKSHHK